MSKLSDKQVNWTVFTWAISIVLVLFATVFTAQAAFADKLNKNQESNGEIKVQLSQIQTDLQWIKLQLK